MKWAYFYNMEQLSVITISFNNLKELQQTCDSVDHQTLPPFEHYIIDGSSNNEISEWLNNHHNLYTVNGFVKEIRVFRMHLTKELSWQLGRSSIF